jgi:hypothetical protein
MKYANFFLRLLLISAIILFNTKNGFAQTEKFLKLNRIINIDSTKRINLPSSESTVFEVTVPSGVVWKINIINTYVSSSSCKIEVGKTAFSRIASLPSSSQNYGLTYANSFWLTENSKVRIVGDIAGSGLHTLFISAEEYTLGQ